MCHKTINTKIFRESLKHFLLRIRDNFYGNPTRNKKCKKYRQKILYPNTIKNGLTQNLLLGNSFINSDQSK